MTNIPTHIYRVRAILALLFLSSASLWAQSDDATLTNITTLAQLDAIHYDLNGDGMVDASASMADSISYETAFGLARKGSITCTGGCSGYELRNDLDFEDADGDGTADDKSIWAEGASGAGVSGAVAEGWAPIGYYNSLTDFASYNATFDGGGYTISNLYINRSSTDNVGLFGVLGTGGNVRNLGIEGGSLSGAGKVGGLVGRNSAGTIRACYATGDVTGTGDRVGGLVGWNNSGTIRACYATGDATGTANDVGGLVGSGTGTSTIRACYATGNATGTGNSVGGLVGWNVGTSTMSACYATGDASGGSLVGGLVGGNLGTVTNCYFDSTVSNRTASDPYDKTTTELQTPTAYAGIYANWNVDVDNGADAGVDDATMAGDSDTDDPWDFGTATQYPVLKVDFNVNGTPTAFEFGGQGRTTVPSAPSALTAAAANTAVTLNWTAPSENGGTPITNYMLEYDTDMNFSSSPTTVPTATAVTSHTISGLTNGTLYYFRVAAVNSVGTGAYYPGATDAAVSATPAPTVPAAPSALMAAAANTAVTLSWTAPTSDGGAAITSYMLEYDTDMNFSSSPTTVTTATAATSHTVSALTNGTLYYFRVAAVNSVGTGASATAVTATPAPTAPAAPSALMATAANAAVTLSWTAATSDGGAAITSYTIDYDTDMNFSSSPTTVTTATAATSHTVSALTNATPYYFRVAAVNSVGTGAYYPGATDAAVSATPAPEAPAAPSALMATAANAAVTLSWTAPTSDGGAAITSYTIDYDTDMNFSSSPTTVPTVTAVTSHAVSGLANGTPYYFRVAAVNSVGTGTYYPGATDAAVSATPAPTAPAAPSALMATAANAAVTLNWTAPTSDGGAAITSYMVEYDTDFNFSSPPTTVSTATAVTSHTVSALTNATPYYFRVAAVNAVGTGASATAVTATPAPTVPAAPSALMATAANTEVTLNWTAPTSDGGAAIINYMVEYDTDMNFSSSPTTVTTATAVTSHTISGLTNATPYYFRVAAVNSVGTGAYYPGATDAAVSATPAPTAPTAPAAPSALMATAANAAVTLNWTAPTSDGGAAITSYMIEYDTDMNFSSSPTTVTTATAATSHTVSSLTNATPYYFRVAAVNAVGTGAYYPGATDAAVSATPAPTAPTAPAAPSALMAMAANAAVTLNWTAPTSDGGAAITGYMLEYDTDMNFSSSPTTVPTATAATSYIVSALTNATPYYFRVAAVNAAGTGAYYPGATDAAVSATPAPTAPAAPTALMAMAADAAVTLNWTAPSDNGGAAITGYMIEYSVNADFSSSPTTVAAPTTSHTVSSLANGTLYYFRVAAVNSVGTGAYYPGATDAAVSATPTPPPPVVSSFSPIEGEVGTSVTITGDNFSATAPENDVRFGGVMAAAPTSASTTSLTVKVPSGAVTGRISVAVGSQTGTSSTDFTVTGTTPAPDPPVVLSFSPSEGEVGISVTITGENFSATALENEVKFGGVMAEDPTSASTTSLVVLVPSGAVTGSISVAVGGQTGTSSENFTVIAPAPAPAAPVVSSFSPTEGEVGTEVTITGVNFSATASENDLRFGGVMAAAPTSASTTSLTVKVPSGARTGRISVAVGSQTGTSSEDFTVTGTTPAPDPPVVLSFSPSEGEVGISVTITGENFSATALENEVKFGGVMAAAPTSASTTSLTVRVPSGARTGSISVAVGGQTGTSSTNFTVTGTTPEPAAFSVPLSSEGDVRVYPNPTSGQLHFKGLLAGGRYVCDLYSLVGQKVLSSVVRAGDTMDTSTLSSGQYILILQAEGRELLRTRLLVVR